MEEIGSYPIITLFQWGFGAPLKAGMWSRHNTLTNNYLRQFSVKKLERFAMELGRVVAAQSVVRADN